MADSFLGVFEVCRLPFGGVTGARTCPGSPQEGPARRAATATSLAERRVGGPIEEIKALLENDEPLAPHPGAAALRERCCTKYAESRSRSNGLAS